MEGAYVLETDECAIYSCHLASVGIALRYRAGNLVNTANSVLVVWCFKDESRCAQAMLERTIADNCECTALNRLSDVGPIVGALKVLNSP